MTHRFVLISIFALQIVCAAFFVLKTFSALLGIGPFSWQLLELIEIGAALGLLLGAVLGGLAVRRSLRRSARIEDQLRAASGAFMELLNDRFDQWSLTPAEKDVALFSIKGLSTAEIAQLRETSEGTVKAQTNAIYRKAKVSGRSQLLALFIDDLVDMPAAAEKATSG
ncbi:helix-turn-helix transcriptional regulator [Octadecabacter sp. 1_MG-2023]|uniref:helix-turn-helix transcriptional regulator n=1 Tax=unclassified Octadecabacter TaxID=196158 RepID=UPI001C08622E|nr:MULTISPECIES: helix-turn-helix transcriptional regulator [unclassified Octadecabacter]MBU2994577.1 helix-turn-helix transcriptional regulator [Octadecabacter sp. B2R22]MDO6734130.1 helix-turn-helix transcriptional regulator [Octadecabacter sp. 1_MG-2023]